MLQRRSTRNEKEKRETFYKIFILSLILLVCGATYYLSHLKTAPLETQRYAMPPR